MTLSNSSGNFALNQELMQRLQKAIANNQQQKLTETEKQLELTFIYAEYAQFDDAIATLKSLIKTDERNAMLVLMLGDLLAIKGDLELAQERYKQAIALATNSSNPQDREILLVAKAELANGMLQEVQKEWQALTNSKSELSERLKAIFNSNSEANTWSNMQAGTVCNCVYLPNVPGMLRWLGGRIQCWLCPVPV
jgi:tetratricopeptide (TPR) repeat protein